MTLSEHLSIHLLLALEEVAVAQLHNLTFESHKNVMESNSGSNTYFKDQAQTGYRWGKKEEEKITCQIREKHLTSKCGWNTNAPSNFINWALRLLKKYNTSYNF